MKILVTGADGFVGRHLVTELTKHGHEVICTSIQSGTFATENGKFSLQPLDVTDSKACVTLVDYFSPDAIVHLAGLAHTKDTEKNLPHLFDVNVAGVSHVAHAMRNLKHSSSKSLLIVSSAFVYGGDTGSGMLSCSENTPLSPRGSYGQSKLAAECTARLYDGQNLDVYIARPFNHIGPGQHPSFVVAGFAARIAAARDGDIIETGNLAAKRDFTDVRDVVRAYRLILEKKPKEKTFVLGSGKSQAIGRIFDDLCHLSKKHLTPKSTIELARSNDDAEIIADTRLAERVLNWTPSIDLSTSLRDVLLTHG